MLSRFKHPGERGGRDWIIFLLFKEGWILFKKARWHLYSLEKAGRHPPAIKKSGLNCRSYVYSLKEAEKAYN